MKLDIPYIAGFIDGEGCINISRLSDVRIVITNTHLETLEKIKTVFNCGTIRAKSRSVKDKSTKVCYMYEAWGRDCENILLQVYPYLFQKQEQAKLALEFLSLMRRRGDTGYKRDLTQDQKVHRLFLQNRVKELKHG